MDYIHYVKEPEPEEAKPVSVRPQPLVPEAYAAYGQVVQADGLRPFRVVNMGRAQRWDFLAEVPNLRPARARLNLCLFRCAPVELPLQVGLLERHPHSGQVFIPLDTQARYLVIVCLGGEGPDLSTLGAFVARGGQGISYHPGVWHYPMTPLDRETDFACLVWEDGTAEDCQVVDLEEPVTVEL